MDEKLRKFATPRQWECYVAYCEAGSYGGAAELLGMSRQALTSRIKELNHKAAKRGYSPDHDFVRDVPEGFFAKGVSTLYDQDGEVRAQWVKAQVDREWQEELLRAAIAGLTETIKPAKPIKTPGKVMEHLMAVYPVGDHHLGMLSWAEETGGDYDLKIGEDLLVRAMDHLVDITKGCLVATVILLGDFFHHDGQGVTPTSGNILDTDGRASKMVRAALKCARYMIDTALRHHGEVHVIIEIGNHDLYSSIFLMEALAAIYENEPRVTIDTSPSHYHYYQFGKCLIGTHHGHGAKLAQLPLIMAADRPKEWGATKYRYWYTGHIHNKQTMQLATTEDGSCLAESFRILPPADAWAANKGHRAGRDMKGIVLHKEYGEVARHTVNPSMLEIA